MRTWVYIDGFNLCCTIRNSDRNWLDINALSGATMLHVEGRPCYSFRILEND